MGNVFARPTLEKTFQVPTPSGFNELSYRNQLPPAMERGEDWQLVALRLPAEPSEEPSMHLCQNAGSWVDALGLRETQAVSESA